MTGKHVRVRIFKDRMELECGGHQRVEVPTAPFTTSRLLVGDFFAAEECLRQGIKRLGAAGWWGFAKPTLSISAMEKVEGGLSPVESRTLLELGYAAGARKVDVSAV